MAGFSFQGTPQRADCFRLSFKQSLSEKPRDKGTPNTDNLSRSRHPTQALSVAHVASYLNAYTVFSPEAFWDLYQSGPKGPPKSSTGGRRRIMFLTALRLLFVPGWLWPKSCAPSGLSQGSPQEAILSFSLPLTHQSKHDTLTASERCVSCQKLPETHRPNHPTWRSPLALGLKPAPQNSPPIE